MFSSALKSFQSNINANYTVASAPSSRAGHWKIYDAKKKSTGKAVSVFVLDRKSLDPHSGSLGRSSAASIKRATEEVVERLKKEASLLARLRHPNILELVEPIEDTRSGGLQFVTESVTASLASLLQEKDEDDRAVGASGRSSRHAADGAESGRRQREVDIDELEIQKGLEQLSKALEFLHDNAGLVHGNLTPEAIFVNAKSDWKLSGLSFSSPPDNSAKPSSVTPINLSEALNTDARLPRSVQMNFDYCSPDFVLDSNPNTGADMFSLGLLIVALYNSPHTSPLQTNSSVQTYKRLFNSSSTLPSPSNGYLCKQSLPKELNSEVLPRLITRRAAQRMTAKEFQQSSYFNSILISTIRFLDELPAKTPKEKAQFMRGLSQVLSSFPNKLLEKKMLPVLLEEMKDRDLLSLILQNVFKIINMLPNGRRPFTEKIIPRLREIFLSPSTSKTPPERDPAKEAGLMVLLEHIAQIANNCSGKEFKDDILPIILLAVESPTHSIVDASLRSLPIILPVLDFSTIKNDLFPVIAAVFSKTSSLAIKVRGLEAFVVLCGGSSDPALSNDGLDGVIATSKKSSSTALDKYTMQEKIVPLIKAIKTKEPAVAVAALNVIRQVGAVADEEFVAIEILPILWGMGLGPLLDLKQFQAFMDLIKSLSSRIEADRTKKLSELSGNNGSKSKDGDDFMAFGAINAFKSNSGSENTQIDFESLVKGNTAGGTTVNSIDSMDPIGRQSTSNMAQPAMFSWSSANPTSSPPPGNASTASRQQQQPFRTITPDLSRFDALAPSTTQFSQPLQPTPQQQQPAFATHQPQSQSSYNTAFQPTTNYNAPSLQPSYQTQTSQSFQSPPAPIDWGSTATNPWAANNSPSSNPSLASLGASMAKLQMGQQSQAPNARLSSFSLPPPPGSANSSFGAPPSSAFGGPAPAKPPTQQKSGLDAYESLI